MVDLDLIKQISDVMRENDILELEVNSGVHEIKLRRGSLHAQPNAPMVMDMRNMTTTATAASAPVTTTLAAPAKDAEKSKYYVVTSPFVGTFYRAPGPNQDSFVEVGKVVNVGDALCIIEAMKLMNEIESDTKGRIVKILVNNATPVEFGEPLFEIDPL